MEETKKIDITEKFERVLEQYECTGVTTSLSYVNRLFPHLGQNTKVLLLCSNLLNISSKDELCLGQEASALDVTGSPLSHSFGDDDFDITLSLIKRNWLKHEEKYQPMSQETASTIINLLHEEIGFDMNWTTPIFALCNAEDAKIPIVLLGSHYDSSWFVTYRITTSAMKSLTSIESGYNDLLDQHLKECSKSKEDTDVTITSTYELCGMRSETIDWKQQLKCEFKGHLRIEAISNVLCFVPSPRGLSNNIIAEIMSGSNESPLNELWNDILLLDRYLSILQEYRKENANIRYKVTPLTFPKDFTTPYAQNESEITLKLNRLLNDDNNFDIEDYNEKRMNDRNIYNMKLHDIMKELQKRESLDFTDHFWCIIRGTENYMQMSDSIYTVFQSITEKSNRIQLNDNSKSRFAKMIFDLKSGNGNVSLLTGSLSLELVIDMGMEKIWRDYMYILSNMNIIEAYDLEQKLVQVSTDEFHVDKYRDKLMNLAQIHISMEFLQLIQSQFNCRCDITNSIFQFALKKYFTTDSPLKYENIRSNTIYTLKMPAPKEFMTAITNTVPSSWMCTLSTMERFQKLTTITHYSHVPIFPPNIYKPDIYEGNSEKDDMYHSVLSVITDFKYK